MQAGRQAYGLAGRRLFTGENDVFASMSVSWTFAVLVYVCEGLQALLQNTPDMPILEDATEHLYQLNHVDVLPQSESDTMTINEGRLFARLDMWDF